jgi:hypothetical protein
VPEIVLLYNNNTISGTATEKGGNDNIITVKNYMYYNTISGTATEKGGNDNIITVYTTCTARDIIIVHVVYTVIILSLPPFSVAVPEIVLLYM